MTEWAPPIEKVTALITRPSPSGPELLVFEHPPGVLQIPAGTVEPGEAFEAAAAREAWEETGALGLELVGEVAHLRPEFPEPLAAFADANDVLGQRVERGWHAEVLNVDDDRADVEVWNGVRGVVPTRLLSRAEDRRIFHLRCNVAMPDEWWVVTPDGDGVTWRCCWIPLDAGHDDLHPWNRTWWEAGRPRIDASSDAPPRLRPPLPREFGDGADWETFFAPPRGERHAVSLEPGGDPERCTRAHGLCVTADGDVLLVQGDDGRWDLPGGGKEGAETVVETFAREVAEEACARVLGALFVTAHRIVALDASGAPTGEVGVHAQMWARVELERWDPHHETTARRLVTPDEAVALAVFPQQMKNLLDRAALIDPALDWRDAGEVEEADA